MKAIDPRGDYHIHTTASDGTFTPTEIVHWARKRGLSTIAITDHDGVDGVEEARRVAAGQGIEVIPGIELSTETKQGVELHILGYDIDIQNSQLQETCQWMRQVRKERNQAYLLALKEMGLEITLADMGVRSPDAYIGKPSFARAMVKRGYIQEKDQAFREIFLREPLRKIHKKKLSVEQGIELIVQAGGMAVLAHPGKTWGIGPKGSREFEQNIEAIIVYLKSRGLEGLECSHPDHTKKQRDFFRSLAQEQGLEMTQGSDFHGD